MNWKYLKIGIIVIFSLALIIPSLLYISAVDWSKKHSTRVAALPLYTNAVHTGEYRLAANGLEFLVRVAGMQNDGPAIILLHGFPESSLMWQAFLEAAAAKGYRVLAFDQRGYSPFARPTKVEAYQIDHLVKDVVAVADQVGFDTFHLGGHDWGAGVGWKTVMDFPERIATWTAMSIPHIGVFSKGLLTHSEQQKRSAYMQKLRTPFLPEFLFQISQEKVAERMKDRWTPEQIAECLAIHKEHGATTAALNWYRAMATEKTAIAELLENPIQRPTLFIWGVQDPVVAPAIIPLQKPYIKAPYQELSLTTGHSLMQTKTDSVMMAIFGHLETFRSPFIQ